MLHCVNASPCMMQCSNLFNTPAAIVMLMHVCMMYMWFRADWIRLNVTFMSERKLSEGNMGIACSCTHATIWKHPWIHAYHRNLISARACMQVGERLFMHSVQMWTRMRERVAFIFYTAAIILIFFSPLKLLNERKALLSVPQPKWCFI